MGDVRARAGTRRAPSARQYTSPGRSAVAAALLSAAEVAAIAWVVAWVAGVGSMAPAPAAKLVGSLPPLVVVAIAVVAAATSRLTVGCLLARATWTAHQGRIVRARQGQARLSRALVEAVDSAEEQQRARARLTHDARNACAGVRASLELLDHHQAELAPEAKARLRQIALFGLAHLEEVIIPTSADAQDFPVTEVVHRVVDGRRLLGSEVAVLGGDVWARGRPHDLATALLNLLVNAERHAAGSLVVVDVTQRGEQVRICVTDGGPGIAAGLELDIFERGWHSSASTGHGLGLHTARELMRRQGGDLTLVPSSVGAAFVLTVPASLKDVTPPTVTPPVRTQADRRSDVMAAR